MSTAASLVAVAFVSVAVSEMLAAMWRGLRRILTRRQDGPKCPCGCGNPPGQHNRPRFPRQRIPQEN